jgi:autotransporter-associated beta strand protein
LVFNAVNTHSKTILKEGTITLLNDDTNPGKTISLEGGTLQCNDNSGSYNTLSWNIDVPTGKSATIRLDSRGYYTGTWSGGGTLNVYIPFVRSDLNGDMSAFSGTVNFISSYSNSSGYPAELRINHSKGFPKALVVVNSSVSASNISGTTMVLGALEGTGELSGPETYQIGAKGIDTEFKGLISAGNVVKVGGGELKLSAANTYSGGTEVVAGKLNANNVSGSATGSGAVTVKQGGTLTGTGIIAGSLQVESGGKLMPGGNNTGQKMTVNNTVTLKNGSFYSVKANPLFKLSDRLVATGTVTISGELTMVNTTASAFKEGDSFTIFEAKSIQGQFSSVSPATPGEGLVWDFSELQSKGLVKVAKATSVKITGRAGFSVYPNPVDDVLNVDWPDEFGICSVEIVDVAGSVCATVTLMQTNKTAIPVQMLQRGVYFVHLNVQDAKVIYKMIKK